jgi:hypothetical protein
VTGPAHDDLRIPAYLSHHNGNPGTLFISSTGVRFAPFITGKKKDKTKEIPADQVPVQIDSDPNAAVVPAPEATVAIEPDQDGVIVDGKEVRIPMDEVSGLGKIQKSTLGVTISSGLEIETLSAGVSLFYLICSDLPPTACEPGDQ